MIKKKTAFLFLFRKEDEIRSTSAGLLKTSFKQESPKKKKPVNAFFYL